MKKTLYTLANPSRIRLSDLPKAVEEALDEEGPLTAQGNKETRDMLVRNWHLGPEKASVDPAANADFWQSIAAVWDLPEEQARRQLCANCEYYDNTPEKLEMMEAVPLDVFDKDGGGRGYCHKFDFICHSLRVCQAWECKPFNLDKEED